MGRGLFCSLISIAHALDVVASQENSYTVQMLRLMLGARMGGGIRFNMRKQSAGERSEQRLRSSPLPLPTSITSMLRLLLADRKNPTSPL